MFIFLRNPYADVILTCFCIDISTICHLSPYVAALWHFSMFIFLRSWSIFERIIFLFKNPSCIIRSVWYNVHIFILSLCFEHVHFDSASSIIKHWYGILSFISIARVFFCKILIIRAFWSWYQSDNKNRSSRFFIGGQLWIV